MSATSLGKRYGNRWLFRRLEISLEPGQCLLVTGANGSGKSTLLRLLAGLEPATEGSISRPDVRTSIGFVSPELRTYANLTALETLQLTATLRGVSSRSDEVLNVVRLDASQSTSTMSTGMRARLRLAIAIQCDPEVLLFDEPGTGLDEQGKLVLQSIIDNYMRKGCAVIATNDPAERRFGTLELNLG